MLKNLIFGTILASSIISAPILSNVQNISYQHQSNQIKYVNETFIIDNGIGASTLSVSPKSGSHDLQFEGPNGNLQYRIFMDSGGDRSLPIHPNQKYSDYIVGEGTKNSWYKYSIPGLSIDVTKYAKTKTDFLKQYRATTFTHFYKYNFWNSSRGWVYEFGKDSPLVAKASTYAITSENTEYLIFDNNSNNGKERANLSVTQEWSGNTLKYNFHLGVIYNWVAGSAIKHAVLAAFQSDSYTFTAVPPIASEKPVKIDNVSIPLNFKITNYPNEIPLDNLDGEIKNKAKEPTMINSSFKTTALMLMNYYGVKQVGNIVHIYSLLMRWLYLPNVDSSMILNGFEVTRLLTIYGESGHFYLHYENLNGNSSTVPLEPANPNIDISDMEMKGEIYLPIVYI